jgi:hypothetical protein
VTTHGDLNASNLIGPLPMLVDWEYAQLATGQAQSILERDPAAAAQVNALVAVRGSSRWIADPVYDLACLSVYYPGLRLRGEELLGMAGITDADGAVRLRLHAQMFDSLNRLWEGAEALRQV